MITCPYCSGSLCVGYAGDVRVMVCYSDEHNYAFLPADATDADKQAAIAYLDAETTKRAKSFIHIPEKWK